MTISNDEYQSKKVLLVDEFSTIRGIERSLLLGMGFDGKNISEVNNVPAALGKVRQQRYDLVISGMNIYDMTGINLLNVMRADDGLKNTPVILVAGEARKSDVLTAAKSGAAFLVKPFTPERFEYTVAGVFAAATRPVVQPARVASDLRK